MDNLHLFSELNRWTVFVFFAIFIITYTLMINYTRKLPGPWIWPLVGNVPSLIGGPPRLFDKILALTKKHGKILSLRMGPTFEMVVVCGHDNLVELFHHQNEYTRFRPSWMSMTARFTNQTGLVWSNGDHNVQMRRFSLSALRDFGLGKTSLEERIVEEANILVETLSHKKGQVIDLHDFVPRAIANIISNIIFGTRFEADDKQFERMLEILEFIFKNKNNTLLENIFPILEKILPNSKVRQILNAKAEFEDYARSQIESHRRTFDPDHIRDFVDLYIKQEDEDNQDGHVDVKSLFQAMFDLYAAGSDTTALTVLWILLYMIKYPEEQRRCREEIFKVVGNKQVCLKDKEKMPYITATINEMLRIRPIAAMGIPRSVLEDLKVGGVTLPKHCFLMPCYISGLCDENYWVNPEEFNPSRFLDENGQLVRQEAFYPFGLGARSCLGKQLADVELFIFFTTLLQKFQFRNGKPDVELDMLGTQMGVTLDPSPYSVILEDA